MPFDNPTWTTVTGAEVVAVDAPAQRQNGIDVEWLDYFNEGPDTVYVARDPDMEAEDLVPRANGSYPVQGGTSVMLRYRTQVLSAVENEDDEAVVVVTAIDVTDIPGVSQ